MRGCLYVDVDCCCIFLNVIVMMMITQELKLESSFLHDATTTRHFHFSTLLGNSLKLRLVIRLSDIRFEMRRNSLITRLLVLVPQRAWTSCSISYDLHG